MGKMNKIQKKFGLPARTKKIRLKEIKMKRTSYLKLGVQLVISAAMFIYSQIALYGAQFVVETADEAVIVIAKLISWLVGYVIVMSLINTIPTATEKPEV